jgi:signal transduction histidine kinase
MRYVMHEVRIPLNAMTLSVDDPARENLDDPARAKEICAGMMTQSATMIRLINDVLDHDALQNGLRPLPSVLCPLPATRCPLRFALCSLPSIFALYSIMSPLPSAFSRVPSAL